MFNKTTRQIGNSGEDTACNFLKKNGYKILQRNYTIRGGEVDVIARDKEVLVFIEVKVRYGNKFGFARESITPWKVKALQKTALFYTSKINWGNKPYRFDLVAIDYLGNNAQIELLKNI